MEKEFKKIEKYFVGFWKYQVYNSNKLAKTCSYCITICMKGNHIDTHAHKNPLNAFKEAVKIVKKLK